MLLYLKQLTLRRCEFRGQRCTGPKLLYDLLLAIKVSLLKHNQRPNLNNEWLNHNLKSLNKIFEIITHIIGENFTYYV